MACTRHITTNMYAAKMGFNQAQVWLVWVVQGAESAAAYLSIMGQLNTLNPKAYDHLQPSLIVRIVLAELGLKFFERHLCCPS